MGAVLKGSFLICKSGPMQFPWKLTGLLVRFCRDIHWSEDTGSEVIERPESTPLGYPDLSHLTKPRMVLLTGLRIPQVSYVRAFRRSARLSCSKPCTTTINITGAVSCCVTQGWADGALTGRTQLSQVPAAGRARWGHGLTPWRRRA